LGLVEEKPAAGEAGARLEKISSLPQQLRRIAGEEELDAVCGGLGK
jgi:hypothetical protein